MTIYRWTISRRMKHAFKVSILVFSLCLIFLHERQKNYRERKMRAIDHLKHASYRVYYQMQKAEKLTDAHQTCIGPTLALWNQDIENYIEPVDPITCDREKEWVYTQNGNFYISYAAKKIHGDIFCTYTPYVNKQDDSEPLQTIDNFANGSKLVSDAFKVMCTGADGRTYERVHACIAHREDLKVIDKPGAFNIMMLGFDSLSRMMIMRLLPKTFEYFTEGLDGEVLEGYNILGDGTPAALMPILTGEQETETTEVRRGQPGAIFVDEALTFIWKRFEQQGYVTQWAEDGINYSTFNLRMLGFKNQPVHHYMRTFYNLSEPTYWQYRKRCYGSKSRLLVFLDWLKEGLSTNRGKKYFTFGFFSELSHDDNNLVRLCDNDITEFMMFMKSEGFLDNTVFVLFSDHGARHGSLRATEQGKLEERMPFVGLHLPESFKQKFPEKVKALRINTKRLTSPFDLHETLIDILDDETDLATTHTQYRGSSLFKDISANRTCTEVGIEAHWCACMQWKSIPANDRVVAVVHKVVDIINDMLKEYQNLCHLLSVHSIKKAVVGHSNKQVLKFKGSSDSDGRVADLNDTLDAQNELYQVNFQTSPGMGLFEATSRYEIKSGLVFARDKDISRLNRYGDASKCVTYLNPELRPYCVCKQS